MGLRLILGICLGFVLGLRLCTGLGLGLGLGFRLSLGLGLVSDKDGKYHDILENIMIF